MLKEFVVQDIDICVSYLSMANMAYVLKKRRSKEQLNKMLKAIQGYVKIFNCTNSQWKRATAHLPVKDFEDLLQYQCAKDHHCDAIITFNKKDFTFTDDISIYTPQEYLNLIRSDKYTNEHQN